MSQLVHPGSWFGSKWSGVGGGNFVPFPRAHAGWLCIGNIIIGGIWKVGNALPCHLGVGVGGSLLAKNGGAPDVSQEERA